MTHATPEATRHPTMTMARRFGGALATLAFGAFVVFVAFAHAAPARALLELSQIIPAVGHPVYVFHDNRLLAHGLRSGGLAVAMGSPGVVKYTRFARPTMPWRIGVDLDGRKVALPLITQVSLELPLTEAQSAGARALYFRLKSGVRQGLRISVNGQKLGAFAVTEGWQTLKVPLAAGTARAGENVVDVAFGQMSHFGAGKDKVRAGVAFEWLELLSADAPAPSEAERVAVSDGPALVLPKGGGVAYYVSVGPGVRLRPGRLDSQGASCILRVTLSGREGKDVRTALVSGLTDVDLAAFAGDTVRVELTAESMAGKPACEEGRLHGAQLMTAGPAPEVKRPAMPKNVIIWLIDSLRADRLKMYNPKSRVETPALDALAKRGVVFAQHYVQGNESRSSHASLWSGLYASRHRVVTGSAKLDTKLPTLAKAVRPSGRYCALRTANGFITQSGGFGEGWHLHKNHIHVGGGVRASDFAKHGVEFLDKHTEPFFLYLGTVDTHVSWRAHEPWTTKYDAANTPTPYQGPLKSGFMGPQLESMLAGKLKLSERDRQRVHALYDSDVSYNDRELGVLMEKLRTSGRLDDTMIIITADHGEELWDHGKIGHGHSLREELASVPLIISYPPLFPSGKVVREGAESIDVLPTILDAIGQPIAPTIQGESLIPLAQGQGQGYPRPSISSQYEFAHAMRLGRWKMWVGGGPQPKLFDVEGDPQEAHDKVDQNLYARRLLTDAFGLFLSYQKRWHKTRWGVASNGSKDLAAELEQNPTTASR